MIIGGMQDWPLRVGAIIDHAARVHGTQEVVARQADGTLHRRSYAEIAARARRLASALTKIGIAPGDRVATMGWNSLAHFEAWYAIPGAGAVCHTINPRLFEPQISWMINHADDRVILAEPCFLSLLARIAGDCLRGRRIVALGAAADIPGDCGLDVTPSEDLIAAGDADFVWVRVAETAPAGLCYTSGTTGDPKGVVYTHRSQVLHTLMVHGPDVLALGADSVALPIVPMYHANAWGITLAAPMVGARLVLPGDRLDGASLAELITAESVTVAGGVPTVWIDLLARLTASGPGTLQRIFTGGSATPRWLLEGAEALGIAVIQGWGMTETSPLATISAPRAAQAALAGEARVAQRLKQGVAVFGAEVRIVDEEGTPLPHDGASAGRLMVRGACVTSGYFGGAGGDVLDAEGWFDTGDIATIDADSFVAITDRAKDVIKSGGEWISSIALENEASGHAAVREAAAIGMPHPRWGERPLLAVVREAGSTLGEGEFIAWLAARVAKWWLPERVVFVEEMPHTATGKLDKKALRAKLLAYADMKAETETQ